MLRTTQIYSLSLATNLDFKTLENHDIEYTEDNLDGVSSSRAWREILNRIQVYNGKKEELDFETSTCIQSSHHLATLHFSKGVRLLSALHTKALLEYFECLNISVPPSGLSSSHPSTKKSEFMVQM